MRVLWFANTPCGASAQLKFGLEVGGWLAALDRQLALRSGVELHVAFYWHEDLRPFLIGRTTYHPIYLHGSGSKAGRFIKRVFGRNEDKQLLPQLIDLVDEVDPDLIHIHGTENNFGLIQGHVRKPVVISIQGLLSPYQEKYFAGIPFGRAAWHEGIVPKMLYRSVLDKYRDMKRSAARERKILGSAKYVIGRTGWDQRVTALLAPGRIYFTGEEILRSSFYGSLWDKTEFGKTIRMVTIMSGGLFKGLEVVVKTAKLLCADGRIDFKWTIIGQDERGELPVIVRRWLGVDFKDVKVDLVGRMRESEIVGILRDADIYVQVSHIENSPNSLCEAMLIGMPIIASYAGGTESILAHGREGVLVQDGDPYSLAGAILEMQQDITVARALGAMAHSRAEQRHDGDRIVVELEDTYRKIMQAENVTE